MTEETWLEARPLGEWHEDDGPALWFFFPIVEAPYCGSPLDTEWPGYHTHWLPLPDAKRIRPKLATGGRVKPSGPYLVGEVPTETTMSPAKLEELTRRSTPFPPPERIITIHNPPTRYPDALPSDVEPTS